MLNIATRHIVICYWNYFSVTYRKAKSKNKFIKATKTITTGGSPGPINNSDILVEENTKVKEIMNIFDFI